MKEPSKATVSALAALASDERLVVSTLRGSVPYTDDDWHACVQQREGVARFTVPIQTFRKMRRDGLLVKEREWKVGGLVCSEYILTDAGRGIVTT